MKRMFVVLVAMSMLFTLSGCGDNAPATTTTTTDNTDNTNPPPGPDAGSVSKATDFTGSWSGTVGVDIASATPVSFDLTGVDATNSVTGDVYSSKLSGPFTGAVNTSTGRASGTVANKVDNAIWTVVLEMSENTLYIVSVTSGTSILGIGSCSATPAMAVNMSGSWVGEIVEINTDTNQPALNAPVSVVSVELAYAGTNKFTGVIVGNKGLVAPIEFFNNLQRFWATIGNVTGTGATFGETIKKPDYYMLTQSPVASIAVLQEDFAANPAAPAAFQSIIFSNSYTEPVTNPFTGETKDMSQYKEYRLSLHRP